MHQLAAVVATAVLAFVGTNMDDFVVLLLLILGTGRDEASHRQIVLGQYIGFCVLVATALAGAALFGLVDVRWIGLLGLLPLALGINGFRRAARAPAYQSTMVGADRFTGGVLRIATVTVANGGDNISVYVPLYREMGAAWTVVTTVSFLVMLGLWCLAALTLGHHARLIPGIVRIGRWLTPSVYVLIGIVVILRATVWRGIPL